MNDKEKALVSQDKAETQLDGLKDFQSTLMDTQKELEETMIKGMSEDGLVIIEMTGSYDSQKVIFSSEAYKEISQEDLSSKILEALKDAKTKADSLIEGIFSKQKES
ncbi:MAG: YbaB/EbfC family nucleoid-associated protein [Alphaproteobacteria bacterium]|nr:YbaB/EbfC family nucleoid-associated protein [Alphaproteobacteria bacterium]